jgi:copper homeostasis protein
MKTVTLEICVDSIEGANMAQAAGAHRIELCTGLAEDGTTPSPAMIGMARQLLDIKVYVLVRPRGGDFLYTAREIEIMTSDVGYCGEAGCDGVVIGMLRPDGTVDVAHCRELVAVARSYGMGVTFHRAFDRSSDLLRAMEEVVESGCERILTSGGYNSAPEGADVLRQLVERAGERIAIMPGAGITPDNAEDLLRSTGAKELHGTFRTFRPGGMLYRNGKLDNPEMEYTLGLPDPEKIGKILGLCR